MIHLVYLHWFDMIMGLESPEIIEDDIFCLSQKSTIEL